MLEVGRIILESSRWRMQVNWLVHFTDRIPELVVRIVKWSKISKHLLGDRMVPAFFKPFSLLMCCFSSFHPNILTIGNLLSNIVFAELVVCIQPFGGVFPLRVLRCMSVSQAASTRTWMLLRLLKWFICRWGLCMCGGYQMQQLQHALVIQVVDSRG